MELINQFKPKQFKVTSLDWVSGTQIALCCTDGLIRIFDFRNFHSCSSPVNRDVLTDRVSNPYLLRPEALWKAKSSMLLGESLSVLSDRILLGDAVVDLFQELSVHHMFPIDRCLSTALMLGDESDYHFWKACMRAMPWTKSALRNVISHSDCSFLLEKQALKVTFSHYSETHF